MKKWLWLVLFLMTVAGGALYIVNRDKDRESQQISDQFKEPAKDFANPPPAMPPPSAPVAPALPEPRRGGVSPGGNPSYPSNPDPNPNPNYPPPDQNFGNEGFPPPPAFDNIPPPAQYPDAPPPPYIPPDPDDFGGGIGEPPPDPYEGVDPQYIPSEPLDGDIIPPPNPEDYQ